ncbi:MAG: protein kinase [Anaerolineae bacterium]
MTQECPHCHHHNRDTAQFCTGCGNPLAPSVARVYVALQSGQTLHGVYRVTQPLGKGGMGAVYLVEDLGAFGRCRVIKEMLQYFDLTDPQAVQRAQQRFEAEGRTLAQLRHHGIPDIISYFSEGGRNYIVMEYVEGDNLFQGLTHEDAQGNPVRGKPYPVEDVLRWGIQLCDVLIYLARQTPPVVHHDVKPANVIIDKNTGEARLVDFGTAKARLVVQPGGGVGVQKSSIYGTAGYAAPEMYNAESSPRSDVYSLAVTLYHLLTDDDPRDHPFNFPKLSELDPALRAALQSALQNDPQQRPDAQAFRQVLKDAQAAFLGEAGAPFIFPDSRRARTPPELARLCDAQWDAAKRFLHDGDFERWLRQSLFRADLADKAASIVQAGGDQDEGLETFLHVLDPRLPYPALRLRPRTLRFGHIAPGEKAQRAFRIRNRAGRGPLKGTIATDQPAPWLIFPDRFDGESDITVTVDTSSVPGGTKLEVHLRLRTAYEGQTVAVRGRVIFPWLRALGQIGLALLVGALVGGYLAFLGMSDPAAWLTHIGVGAMALSLAWLRAHRAQVSWKGRVFRLLFYVLLFGTLLMVADRMCYSSWSLMRRADVSGAWVLPTAAGAILGLAVGTIRALSRPGRRLIPRLFAAFILLGSLSYCGWTLYRVVGHAVVSVPILPLRQTATITPPPARTVTWQPVLTVRPGEIAIGAQVIVVTDGRLLNVRQAPGTDVAIITRVEPGTRLEVLDGPRMASGYTWWCVKLLDGTIGWAAENWLKPAE